MYQEVLLLVEQSHTDERTQTALSLLIDKIKAAEDGDVAMFIPVMDEINKLAIQCFDTYEECIGDNNNNYVNTTKMDTRPKTKPTFDIQWASMSKSMHENATVLFKLNHKVWQLHEQLHECMLWDGIIVPEPPAKSDIIDDTYMSEEELLRRRTIVTTHQNELLMLVMLINKMMIACITAHKESALDFHVTYHGNRFIWALEIPALEGVRDTYTVYMKDDLDEEKDLIIHAAAGTNAEEPLPKKNLPKPTPIQMTLMFKDKGKAKATIPDLVIEHEDILVTVFEQEHTLALVLEDAHIPLRHETNTETCLRDCVMRFSLYQNLESNTPAITAENQKHLVNVALKVSSINKELY
ncbi:uncharacterized protein F5891DRAFT_983320 [Suillus fuscotomentosus]|uniref:Uncharacterized protein n=1 Tax=Suillus fuscotomentosus TaxID=1912939 RepID=A0AAD4DZF0_9AGAM|nr:uncharacterized protein F5891DRAFT_983320 [Suillus fuscotomentosus]KAG1896720.1 hypothetical protein F5891DRAFT_983320 [Suillus fuscotomentosus]